MNKITLFNNEIQLKIIALESIFMNLLINENDLNFGH